jgi:uncharacterized membrane protein
VRVSEPVVPSPVDREALPETVRALLHDDEAVLFYAQPIRRAGGIGVWMILGVGIFYLPAGIGALNEIADKASRGALGVGAIAVALFVGAGALLLLALSVLWIFWPLLSDQDRRRTHVVVTDERVLQVKLRSNKPPRVKDWSVAVCDAASVARRRGESATLVLKERVRERKSDGQSVYEWDAVHGLPRADEALTALLWARQQRLAILRSV